MPHVLNRVKDFWSARSQKQKWLIALGVLFLIAAGSTSSDKKALSDSSANPIPSESIVSARIETGVMPNILGMNAYDASSILDKSGFTPNYNPTSFEDIASRSDFKTLGISWFICKQDDAAGLKASDPSYTSIYVSKDCTGWASLPNVVGMKAAAAWPLLINRGFTPNFDYSSELTAEQQAWTVCTQDHPVGSTKTDEDIALDLSKNCATSPNNPDSRDGTRIFINESLKDINSIANDVNSLQEDAQGNHTILINIPRLAIGLRASSLQSKLAPTKFKKAWEKANQNLRAKLDEFESALSDWIDNIINTNEFLPYIDALRNPVANLKNLVSAIPYPN